jgi:hypothetical protein
VIDSRECQLQNAFELMGVNAESALNEIKESGLQPMKHDEHDEEL